MVSKKEKLIFDKFQFYDKHRRFPEDRVRIDITISQEALFKLEDKNRSRVINDLIIAS